MVMTTRIILCRKCSINTGVNIGFGRQIINGLSSVQLSSVKDRRTILGVTVLGKWTFVSDFADFLEAKTYYVPVIK